MKVIVEIPDKQAPFGMEVLRSLSFVKNAKPMSKDAANIYESLQESMKDVRLHQQGKIKLRTAEELIDEL